VSERCWGLGHWRATSRCGERCDGRPLLSISSTAADTALPPGPPANRSLILRRVRGICASHGGVGQVSRRGARASIGRLIFAFRKVQASELSSLLLACHKDGLNHMFPAVGSRAGQSGRRRIISWIVLIIAAAVALGIAWLAGPWLLRCVAELWVVSDRLERADVIVVLGGGVDVRPAAAADLYQRGIAPRVAIGVSEFDGGRSAGHNRDMLIQHGVPRTAIVEFSFRPHSTYGEARGILAWAKSSGAKSVIIPTDIFPTRRVRWIFTHELAPAGIRVTVQAVTPPRYSVDDWWQHKAGRTHFRNELIKFAYYRLRY
jgi:uncharacterized SAM-binding protein YcdF (DUF218 family)